MLRLPAEVRNQIYEYALGHNTLHISRHIAHTRNGGCVIFFKSCICTVHKWWSNDLEHPFHHDVCRLDPFVRRLHLSLLRSCSQIYMEAALFPFIHNTFSFAHGPLMPQFISSLVPAQATAITSLSLSNIFAADLLDRDYWVGFPDLCHLAVVINGHEGCTDEHGDLRDYRRFNGLCMWSSRKVWQEFPLHEPLEHFNLESFKLRIVCASGLTIKPCSSREEWEQWAETIEQRVLARRFKKRLERRQDSERRLLQIRRINHAVPGQSWLGDRLWRVTRWCIQWLADFKRSLVIPLPPSRRIES